MLRDVQTDRANLLHGRLLRWQFDAATLPHRCRRGASTPSLLCRPRTGGLQHKPVTPGAYFDGALGEFILQYVTVRDAAEPDAGLLDFPTTLPPMQPRWRLLAVPAWRWNLPMVFQGSASAEML